MFAHGNVDNFLTCFPLVKMFSSSEMTDISPSVLNSLENAWFLDWWPATVGSLMSQLMLWYYKNTQPYVSKLKSVKTSIFIEVMRPMITDLYLFVY